jgi:hypothetical protein
MYKPAGGIKSKNVVAKPVRTGPGAKAVNKRWVSDIGQSKGNHVNSAEGGGKTLHGVRAYPHKGPSFNPGIQGNKVAAATVCGPGGSRVIYKSGGQHGLTTRQSKSDGRGFDD